MKGIKSKSCKSCGRVSLMFGRQERCGHIKEPGSCTHEWYIVKKAQYRRSLKKKSLRFLPKKKEKVVKKVYERNKEVSDWLMY